MYINKAWVCNAPWSQALVCGLGVRPGCVAWVYRLPKGGYFSYIEALMSVTPRYDAKSAIAVDNNPGSDASRWYMFSSFRSLSTLGTIKLFLHARESMVPL